MNYYQQTPNIFSYIFDPLTLLIILVIVVLSILILREIITWYWKINEIVKILKEININSKISSDIL